VREANAFWGYTGRMSKRRKSVASRGIGAAVGTVRSLMGLHHRPSSRRVPGSAAGLEPRDLTAMARKQELEEPAVVTCIDYCPAQAEFQQVEDVEDFIIQNRPEWSEVRWINVDGLEDPDTIKAFAEKYDLHPLAIEDVLHVPQRPKVDTYPTRGEIHGRVFVVTRMLRMLGEKQREEALHGEQVSIFLGRKTVLSFQERHDGDIFDPVRARIRTAGSRIRENDASFLLYALLDAIVDNCFPILEHYSDLLEDLEDQVLARPDKRVIQRIHSVKRELLLLRRAVWPMREVISALAREHHECLSANTQTYLRDVYDHTVQIIDMVETYREFASGMTETYMSAMSNRMNEVIKVLTIITTIFVPLTFLAGVYGMNFEHLPEKNWYYGYYVFWGICVAAAVGMIGWFKWRKWL
jgi:magnesium transporter